MGLQKISLDNLYKKTGHKYEITYGGYLIARMDTFFYFVFMVTPGSTGVCSKYTYVQTSLLLILDGGEGVRNMQVIELGSAAWKTSILSNPVLSLRPLLPFTT